MKSGTEKWVQLKETIPVYIGYFTCFVDDDGVFNFYEDVYNMDDRLFDILIGYKDSDQ